MTPFQASVAAYTGLTPDLLASLVREAESRASKLQSDLAAMRKAQRIQKMGKPPQHTKP